MAAFTVRINRSACTKCGACLEVCPQGVFVFANASLEGESEERMVMAKNVNDCVGCLVCFESCPEFAISVKPTIK